MQYQRNYEVNKEKQYIDVTYHLLQEHAVLPDVVGLQPLADPASISIGKEYCRL